IPQPILDGPVPDPLLLEPGDDSLLGPVPNETVEKFGVDRGAVSPVGPVSPVGLSLPVCRRLYRTDDFEPVPRGEVPVPLILTGDRHDGPGPVPHQHIVGDVDGEL